MRRRSSSHPWALTVVLERDDGPGEYLPASVDNSPLSVPEQLHLDLCRAGAKHSERRGVCCSAAVDRKGAPVDFVDSVEAGGSSAVRIQICLFGEDGAFRVDELQQR